MEYTKINSLTIEIIEFISMSSKLELKYSNFSMDMSLKGQTVIFESIHVDKYNNSVKIKNKQTKKRA